MAREIHNGAIIAMVCDSCGAETRREKHGHKYGEWYSELPVHEWATFAKGYLVKPDGTGVWTGPTDPPNPTLHPIVVDYCPACSNVLVDVILAQGLVRPSAMDLNRMFVVGDKDCEECKAKVGTPHLGTCTLRMHPPWRSDMNRIPLLSPLNSLLMTMVTVTMNTTYGAHLHVPSDDQPGFYHPCANCPHPYHAHLSTGVSCTQCACPGFQRGY